MSGKTQRPFGLWDSPVTTPMLARMRGLSELAWESENVLLWHESRGGKPFIVVQHGTEAPRDVTEDVAPRARVGYGGGDFAVAKGFVYYPDAATGRLFRQPLAGGAATPLTPPFGKAAAPRVSPDGRFVAYVHHDAEKHDRIAVVDSAGKHWPQILAEGHDFYAFPRWSADGKWVAFVAWDHPHMPWDASALYLAPVAPEGSGLPRLGAPVKIAGGDDASVFQPEFTPDGRTLLYVSDESGWSQIHAFDLASRKSRKVTDAEDVELGRPLWVQEVRTYAVSHDSRVVYAAANKRGFVRMMRIDLESGQLELIDALSHYTDTAQPAISPDGKTLAVIASAGNLPPRLVTMDLKGGDTRVVARATAESLRPDDLSTPVPLTWKTGRSEECHGLYYPPASATFAGAGKPPLIVIVHGGPTAQVRAAYSAQAQFFATRGYGVLYVNHRGSTGYGRAYMKKLNGNWGLVDVQDSVSGARHLAEAGKVDGKKTVIMGGSAGGYTVLQTMVDEPEAFAAGICLYGIANQFTLVAATHKFEERYNDVLLGPLPEAADLWRQRSPLFHAAKIKRPLAVFQGEKDEVVPKDQAETLVAALRRGGTPHVYHVYAGEGHGWRKPETIEHFYGEVDAFLKQYIVYS